MNADEEKFVDNLTCDIIGLRAALNDILWARDVCCLSDAQFVAKQALAKYNFLDMEDEDEPDDSAVYDESMDGDHESALSSIG